MSLWDALRMNMMISYQELVRTFPSFAHPVSVTADTLDSAEAKIATIAKEQGASYHVTEAYTGNQVHMTAELSK